VVAGVPNVFKVTDRLYSGGSPDGELGFKSLGKLGIKTIISVDGARPDVELAAKYGMRYVHLPIGYDGVPENQVLKIARAVRDLPGPVYLHCHHGKHRAPAAAAAVLLCLDAQCPVRTAVHYMKAAGTDPHYRGLYDSVSRVRPPTDAELHRVPNDFPAVAKIPAMAQMMVKIDEHWDRLQRAKKAGWVAPTDHPDIDPPHEALQLGEQLRECARSADGARKYPDPFWRALTDAAARARELEQALRTDKKQAINPTVASERFQQVAAACVQCHAKFRDVPNPNGRPEQ
jgi:protein tyrosine phosphatase (PTP) superfamily phosphohydrolase (DUF442 family)